MNFQPRIRSASETNPGVECCTANDPKFRCAVCTAHFGTPRAAALRTNLRQEPTVKDDYTPPDPYAAPLAKLRAATATPASTFAEEYAATRTKELADSRAAIKPAKPVRLTVAEVAAAAPPDPYAVKEAR